MLLTSGLVAAGRGYNNSSNRERPLSDGVTQNGFGCGRSYSPVVEKSPSVPCSPRGTDAENGKDRYSYSPGKASGLLASRSPPASPVKSVVPAGAGVFLPNCQLSADFVQLRATDATAAASVPVRLYLTATEFVRKTANAPSSARRADRSSKIDFTTMHSYPLQSIEISRSKVSSSTMMVSISGCAESRASKVDVGVLTTNKSGETKERKTAPEQCVVVEAYRLCPDQQQTSIQDWIESVETNKRKLAIMERLKQSDVSSSSTTAAAATNDLLESVKCRCTPSTPTKNVSTSARPSSIALSNHSSPVRRVDKRRSNSGYDFSSLSLSQPTRDKLPTTANGRYTPLHHHYSPHPLFSNSSPPRNSGHNLRHHHSSDRTAPFRLFRRLSLGGGQKGTYKFPPSPANLNNENSPARSRNWVGKNARSTTRTIFSIRRSYDSIDDTTREAITAGYPSSTDREVLGHESHRNGGIFRDKRRRPTLSRSVSEYHEKDDDYHNNIDTPEVSTKPRVKSVMHQTSDPLPIISPSHTTSRGNTTSDDKVPLELKALQSFLDTLSSPHSSSHPPPSTASPSPHLTPPSHSPSEEEEDDEEEDDDDAGFQSFLRHKQIRGRKIHISPRAQSVSVSSDILSPPAWVDKFHIPLPSESLNNGGVVGSDNGGGGGSATLPRGRKVKSEATSTGRTTKTLDREVLSGSSSPVPKTGKTQKIFRRFHHRWQSLSGVKLESEMIPTSSATVTDRAADVRAAAAPEKLYLLPAKEVAEGLTRMDADLLGLISPDELNDGAWMKRGQKEKLAPNILAMVHSFNQLALLVPTEILSEQTHHQRAKVISAYIQIANKCYYLKNYNSLKAILAGLQSTPVHRLRKTWKDVPSKRKKRFKVLCKLMSEDNNWQEYRDELDGCLASSSPCIPYLGQFLTQVCHQLSYNEMKAEREEVKLRRRSKSFVGGASGDKHNKKESRRRSNSFHRSSLDMSGGEKRVSAASLSTPVSPVASDDEVGSPEDENGPRGVVRQVRRKSDDGQEDAQSLEFSLSLDDQALDASMSQPEPTTTDVLPGDAVCTEGLSGVGRRKRSSQQTIIAFHSTPVKDANGYIRPLCVPFPRELDFESALASQGYDEPDSCDQLINLTGNPSFPVSYQQMKSSDKFDDSPEIFRKNIPSISLEKTSSHSSLEDWAETETRGTVLGARKIGKSRSFESSLIVSMNVNGEGSNHMEEVDSRMKQLALSHSIPSLDSDSVFSIEDEQGEEVGEKRERRGESGEREGERDQAKSSRVEGTQSQRQGDDLSFLEHSGDSDFITENARSIVTRSLPTSTFASTLSTATPTPHKSSREREALLSPESSLSENVTHSRDHSFSTVESSSMGQSHDARDSSFSPVSVPNAEKISNQKEPENDQVSSGGAGADDHGKNKRGPTVQRSKSVSSSGNYRNKWRWKRAIADNKHPNITKRKSSTILDNANPFHLLKVYQKRSSDTLSSNSTGNKVDFRTFLDRFSNNSETRNYELSFEREP